MSYSSEVLADSPKAYYRMQEASGLIQDSSGLAHHATSSTGTATYQQASPILSEPSDFSIDFNADDFIVPDHADLDWGDVFTAEAWVYKGDSGTTRAISGRGSQALTWGTDTSDLLFAARADIGLIVSSTVALSTNTWYHCAYTKNGATSKIYINGDDRTGTVTDSTMVSVSVSMRIGADYNGTIGWLGKLDEVAFYSTALSQADIQRHYAAALAPAPPLRVVASGRRWM